MLGRFLENYLQRHAHPASQVLHLVGVPMTFVASVVFACRAQWWWAGGCFLGGYFLQWIGHLIEGNDMGEVILVKRWLGLPYTEFGPPRNGAQAGPQSPPAPSTNPRSMT